VHVGIGLFGRWNLVFGDGEHEIHVQVLAVPFDGFLGILAAIGDVMNFLNLYHG
jgi:hypothetical protein